jgi:tRNA A37 methylthiotransferase MiaB
MPDERTRLGAAGRRSGRRRMVATSDLESADVVVFNTCCIRENADNKFYGQLGNLKTLRRAGPTCRSR